MALFLGHPYVYYVTLRIMAPLAFRVWSLDDDTGGFGLDYSVGYINLRSMHTFVVIKTLVILSLGSFEELK